MSSRDHLIGILSDGEPHSGSALATALGISRSAVWKQVHALTALGLELHSDRRRGYRLARPLELLGRDRVVASLGAGARVTCEQLDVLTVTESTSTFLSRAPAPATGRWRGAIAEFQTGGRGRRSRRWISPFGSGLCLSLSWRFDCGPPEIATLSLAAGVAVVRALSAAGASRLTLKWPNDVLSGHGKLGGLLVDVDGDSRGPLRVIVGVGLNLTLTPGHVAQVLESGGLPPAALETAPAAGPPERNALAGGVMSALVDALQNFAHAGFAPFAEEWDRLDYLRGRPVRLQLGNEETNGVARGIDPTGALLLERADGVSPFFSGEVSLRPEA